MNIVTIDDCFQYNERVEFSTKENPIYCNNCKKDYPFSYCTKLYIAPSVLIIVLNRAKGIEFNMKLEFSEDLNLDNFVENKGIGARYILIGVVANLGESDNNEHFIAYCRNPIDYQWYRYNDDMVTKAVSLNDEIMNCAIPYILFFQNTALK